MENVERPPKGAKCIACGKALRGVGSARKNGRPHNDWASRELHKKCFIERAQMRETEQMVKALRNAPVGG